MQKLEWYIGRHGSIMTEFQGKELQVTCISPTRFCGNLTEEEKEFRNAWEEETKGYAKLIVDSVNNCGMLKAAIEDAMGELAMLQCDNTCNEDHLCRACSAEEILRKAIKLSEDQ